MTGRGLQLRRIEAAIGDPITAGVVICGAAGVGKTRLARAGLDAAAARGCAVRWAVGTSAARGLPLGALQAWAGSAGRDNLQLVRGVIESLTAAAPGVGVVVGVDDVHLLDDLSTFVLYQVLQRRAATLVLTIRDGDHIPVAVQELWKDFEFDRMDLEPLGPEHSEVLLARTLAGGVDPNACRRLWQLTGGNPLYLRHVVEQEVADGRLSKRYDNWQWSGRPEMPRGLVELIESRIGELPDEIAEVLDTLAVGEPVGLDVLRRITSAAAVEQADACGLIVLDTTHRAPGAEVRVAHPLYAEVRRRRAAPTRLRRLRGLVAAELGAEDDGDDVRVAVRRATLSLDSDLPPDSELLVRAAQGAIYLADLPLADQLAEAAARAGAGPEAQFIRAHALSWLSRGEEAEEVLAGIEVARLDDREHARFTYLRASNMLWALADPRRARAIIDAGAHIADAQARSCIDAVRTVYLFAVDRPAEANTAAAGLVLDELPAIVGTETAWALTTIRADAGRTVEALGLADAGYAVAARCSDAPHMIFNIADAHVGALLLAGRVSEALVVAERAGQQAADLPGAAQVLGAAIAGRAALGAGRLGTASLLLEQAGSALASSGHAIGWGYRYRLPHAVALAMRGLAAEAGAALAALDALRRPFRLLDDERSLARAWVAAGQGALSEAIAVLYVAAGNAAALGRFGSEVMCLQTAVQFGDRSALPRLRELETLVEGPRAGLAARFAGAMQRADAAELSLLSTDFEAMGDVVAAVDAAAHAALEYRRQDLRGSALGCVARAEMLAERCGGADTPALRQARTPLPLTDREREIVALVAKGLANREIAERLTLSPRTVEGHIYKAMAKTGTSSREELAALLPEYRPGQM